MGALCEHKLFSLILVIVKWHFGYFSIALDCLYQEHICGL